MIFASQQEGKVSARTRRGRPSTITGRAVRLTATDRAALTDLARVNVMTESDLAWHYRDRQDHGARALDRLVRGGQLTRLHWIQPGVGHTVVFAFADSAVAGAWGGTLAATGRRCSVQHEVLVSRLYCWLGRPPDFRLPRAYSTADLSACGGVRPDAMYTGVDGQTVFVEADGGQYTRSQVLHKLRRWAGRVQVWGQPQQAHCVIPTRPGITVVRF